MRQKKIAIIGKGTAGCLTAGHYAFWTNWDIDWYYDSNIKAQSVGEGSLGFFPRVLYESFSLTCDDMSSFDGTIKLGIHKLNWSNEGGDFKHLFRASEYAYHFNAVKLQNIMISKLLNNPRINIIDRNVNHSEIDADYILDCSGRPHSYESCYKAEYIPVNSVHVNQCYWEYPKFQYTLTIARPYGWVFGIPLHNRCSIGYMYNNNINTIEEVKEDIKEIFKQWNLIPSQDTNSFSFNNYYRKKAFEDGRIAYNGNACFFLEPMEATSISTIALLYRYTFDIWVDGFDENVANDLWIKQMKSTETMIMMHYLSGSMFNTEFWIYANEKAIKCYENSYNDIMLKNIIKGKSDKAYGFWPQSSWDHHIEKLKIRKILNEYILH